MFANQTHRFVALGGLFGVGLVLAGWLAVATLMMQTYTHATDGVTPAPEQCELVCRTTQAAPQG